MSCDYSLSITREGNKRKRALILTQNIFIWQNVNKDFINFVTFKKIDPTKYLVEFKNKEIKESFALVFNQTFSPHWKIYAGTKQRKPNMLQAFETFGMKELAADKHFKSNYFSNTWILEPEDIKNADYLIIEFSTQRLFYVGLVISVITLIVIYGLAVSSSFVKRKR